MEPSTAQKKLDPKELDFDRFEATQRRQLDIIFSQLNTTGFFALIAGLVIVGLSYGTERFETALVWFTFLALFITLRGPLVFRPMLAIQEPVSDEQYVTRNRVLHASWFISGCTFGLAGYLFLPTLDEPQRFVAMVGLLFGLVAGNLHNFYWSSRFAGILFVHPMMLGLIIRCLEYGYYIMFAVIVVFVVVLNALTARISSGISKEAFADIQNKRAMRELEKAKRRAEQENLEKDRFLAAASHDIRQPLNSMGMFLYSLRHELGAQPDVIKRYLEGVELSHSALKELFSALSDLTTLGQGAIKVQRRPIDVDRLLEPIKLELERLAQSKGIALRVPSNTPFRLDSDPFMLSRVIRNLVGNAIRYTDSGSVTISLQRFDDVAELSVVDTGKGIPEAQLKHIFDEYYQVQEKSREERQGLGLGLAIVQRICELLDHSISVSSRVGKGTEFTLVIPISDAKVDVPELVPFYGLCVLVIDDDTEILNGMRSMLKSWDCDVITAANRAQALEHIKTRQPDFILSDYRLGDHDDGLSLLLDLGKNLNRNVPGFIITGDTDFRVREEVNNAGFEIIYKPLDPIELHEKMEAALSVVQSDV